MEQNPSWEANTHYASQIPSILWNTCTPKAYNDSIHNQMNPVHNFPQYFCKINFDITFPSRFSEQLLAVTFSPPKRGMNLRTAFVKPRRTQFSSASRRKPEIRHSMILSSEYFRMPCQSHHPWFYNPDFAYRVQILTRQSMHLCITRNIAARSSNHCCRGKSMSIPYSLYVCVCSLNYTACNARAPNYVYICDLWLYHIFPHSQTSRISSKVFENKMC